MKQHPPPLNVTRARQLRREPTDAERAMWRLLREVFPDGRWRRQIPLGRYIADFCSHRFRVVIEVDGGQHSEDCDAARTAAIEAEGYRIVRFWNGDVLTNRDGVALAIAEALRSHPQPASTRRHAAKSSHPSPIEGEGR